MHWLSTGEVINTIDLSSIRSIRELKARAFDLKPNRGEWILGFGWDEGVWEEQVKPHFSILDQIFPQYPVAFSRIDGHALWVNSIAMKIAHFSMTSSVDQPPGGRIVIDDLGNATGVFVDSAKEIIQTKIPEPTRTDLKRFLYQGMEIFNHAGFTHIRDVGGSLSHWQLASEIEKASEMTLYCEMYFNLESFEQLHMRVQEVLDCQKSEMKHLRVAGIKAFLDGALGSEGAHLSCPYKNGARGLSLYRSEEVGEILSSCWKHKIPVAFHALGDEAVHQVVVVAENLKNKGIEGELHLEHCEVIRGETIQMMSGLNIRCHLQPSHFLTDRRWLKDKLGHLYKSCFPWHALSVAGIPMNFGSDSPIEEPSLFKTYRGLELASAEGILFPQISPWVYHTHPDGSWGANCVTKLSADGSVSVHFQ